MTDDFISRLVVMLDPNGFPYRHAEGHAAAARELSEYLSELPETVCRMTSDDLELCVDRMLARYWQKVRPSPSR